MNELVTVGQELIAVGAEEAEAKRKDLLRPENLAAHIRFNGNRPYLDPDLRRDIMAASIVSAVAEVAAGGPWNALKKEWQSIVGIWTNLKRRQVNVRYADLMVAKLDAFDSMLAGLGSLIDRREQSDLWDACTHERLVTLRSDLDDLWRRYRVEWVAAGYN